MATDNAACPALLAMDDEEILQNVDGRMQGPMHRFTDKYFGSFKHTYQGSTLEIQKSGSICGRYSLPSSVAPPVDNFLPWFFNVAASPLETCRARGSWHLLPRDSKAPDGHGAVPFFLSMPERSASNEQMKWACVQVIGQLYHQPESVSYQDGLVCLCQSAHQVFLSQPTRLFLHGLYMRGPLVEIWVFDRSGIFCSDVIDIRNDFTQFLSLLLSYQHMTDEELGKSQILETDSDGHLTLPGGSMGDFQGTLQLEDYPIVIRQDLVGEGTTCYRAKPLDTHNWSHVVKFKWRWAQKRPENELLAVAQEKGAYGAISLHAYQELESTANLRASLRWGPQKRFITELSSTGDLDERIEGNSKPSKTHGLAYYTENTQQYFHNRYLACSITSPLGRPLSTFRTIPELLQVFRDAIMCHRSLYNDAGILHCDISHGNIIIVDREDGEEKPNGVLIDLDSALQIGNDADEEKGIIGTRPFMAIGVLKDESHTYRHDLESFLYVLLWTIITNHEDSPPEGSKLRKWSDGDWEELAARKYLDIAEENGFQELLQEFDAKFHSLKLLVENLRRLLFPSRDGKIWTGTDHAPEEVAKLYGHMIAAFEEATVSASSAGSLVEQGVSMDNS